MPVSNVVPDVATLQHRQLRDLAEKNAGPVSRRARIMLALIAAGPLANEQIDEIASTLGVSAATVRRVARQFAEKGIDGLADAARSGAPRVIPEDIRARIVALCAAGHTNRQIAQMLSISQSSVSRLAREARAQGATSEPTDSAAQTRLDTMRIDLIDSLADDVPWKRFLEKLRVETRSDYCTIMIYSDGKPKPTVVLVEGPNIMADDRYHDLHYSKEVLFDIPEGQVRSLSDVYSATQLRSTEFYQQYLGPAGIGHVLGTDIREVRGISARMRLSRFEAHGDYGLEERRTLAAIIPYLRSALRVFVRRSDTEVEKEALSVAVSGMSVGSLMVSAEGRIIEANGPALTMLRDGDGVLDKGGRITLQDQKMGRQLLDLIRRNAEASVRIGDVGDVRALLIERPSGRESISLLVRPATTMARQLLGIRPMALIHLVDPAQPRVKMIDALIQLFGLTAAEARIAALIANGQSVQDIVTATGNSANTVRSQLRAIFSKLGVRRQSQLIRAVLVSVGLLSLPDVQ